MEGIPVIWYSCSKTASVILPPEPNPALSTPLKVTKSLTTAPWLESVAVMVEEPLVAAKVMPLVVVALIGVTSLRTSPSLM